MLSSLPARMPDPGKVSLLFLREEIHIRIDPFRFVALRVAEEVAVHVFEIDFFLLLVQAVPDGDVEGAADLLHHGESELASFAGSLNLFVVELFGGRVD